MATLLEEQLLEAKLAEIRENPPDSPEIELDEPVEVRSETRGRSTALAKNGGKFRVFNKLDGSAKYPPVSIIAEMLSRKEGGRTLFTTEQPKGYEYVKDEKLSARWGLPVVRRKTEANYLCPLHPDAPERAEMDRIGLRDKKCSKALVNIEARDRHFENRHNGAFKAWEREERRARDRREQERHDQMAELLKTLAAQKGK